MRKVFIALGLSLFLLSSGPLYAGQYGFKEMTPAVEKAIEGRQARYKELSAFQAEQKIGESNEGFVVAFGDAEAEALVKSENRDRLTMYKAIVEQNSLGDSALSTVQKVFGEERRERAPAGAKVQLPSGEWIVK